MSTILFFLYFYEDGESTTGEVLTICDDFIDYGRNAIMVQWFDDEYTKQHNILELICEEASIFPYYPDHLPILGKGITYLLCSICFDNK